MNDPHEPRPGNDPQRSVPQYGEYTGEPSGPRTAIKSTKPAGGRTSTPSRFLVRENQPRVTTSRRERPRRRHLTGTRSSPAGP